MGVCMHRILDQGVQQGVWDLPMRKAGIGKERKKEAEGEWQWKGV